MNGSVATYNDIILPLLFSCYGIEIILVGIGAMLATNSSSWHSLGMGSIMLTMTSFSWVVGMGVMLVTIEFPFPWVVGSGCDPHNEFNLLFSNCGNRSGACDC